MDFLTDPFLIDPGQFDGPVLVTGAGGCIGSWALTILTRSGVPCVAFDLRDDRRRPGLIMGTAAAAGLTWETGDIADAQGLQDVVARHGITAIIHLAGLQVPFCKADPAAGARVNVEGTINVLQASRQAGIKRTVYASSVAAHGMPAGGPNLATLYGAYKSANEQTAKVYWLDWQVPSVGIRPNIVYGVARDQGVSSKCTVALLAAMLGQSYEIPYSGNVSWLYAGEAAAAFIAAVSRDGEDAPVFDLNGACESVESGIALIKGLVPGADITCSGGPFPLPMDLDDGPIQAGLGGFPSSSLADGITTTHRAFAALIENGQLDAAGVQ